MSGQVYGRAGTSLAADTRWARNAGTVGAGRRGEANTAAILDAVARSSEMSVLHDVRIPIPGMRLNIDHIAVAGKTVLLIDSKLWKPGFLWTFRGHTRRGRDSFDACDKRTVQMAHEAFCSYLAGYGARFACPVVAVWPSRDAGKVSTWAATFPAAVLLPGHKLERHVRRALPVHDPADPALVTRIRALVV